MGSNLLIGCLILFPLLARLFWLQNHNTLVRQKLMAARKRCSEMHEQLSEQAELFRTMFDSAPECVKLQNEDGTIVRINATGLSLLETDTPATIVGQSVYSVIAPEYHQAYQKLTDSVFLGNTECMEFELITFEGRRRWLETHAVPLRNDQGDIKALLAITRDIEERKQMSYQMEEQRNRLQTIIESEPECVKLQDRYGTILEMNPAGLVLLNATHSTEVIGRSVYEFLNSEYHEAYQALTQEVFAGNPGCMEFEVTGISGAHRWLETHAAPLWDNTGKVTALLAITRDIDDRKQSEDKMRRQHEELAHVCRLSTIGELATGLAHELNQPLCAISSYAESAVLLNARPYGKDPTKVDQILQKIVCQTERANGILQRLRDFVRKKTPKPQANQALSLIENMLEFIDPERRRQGIIINVTHDDPLPDIWVDRVQIEQVILNLITNAIQATNLNPDNPRKLSINIMAADSDVTIMIRDYAGGVPDKIRPNLFTPFITTKEQGLGIGLALSHSIAEAHGGRLRYQPADPGSLFSLTLPCRVQDA
ncbi:PAS domain-containing sensor histidine kinase [Sedimenticola sp.]|uniref:PAS domain-containing sensor histidine kinase n=1 Tax=Sedimenticola sp. TaxID=1940285 RepID=UPI00258E5468|nr:PAS domain-containing sensor histidine kinase [Sedimenticola sp.]MCW8903269.1 PAS domain S-box protein [Sedimenticola sp.]